MIKLAFAAVLIAVVADANLLTVFNAGKHIFKDETGEDWGLNAIDVLDMPGEYEFLKFKQTYNKTYKDAAEHNQRFLHFKVNHLLAKAHEKMDMGTAKYGVTMFSDMSNQEFKVFYRNLKVEYLEPPSEQAPEMDAAKAPAAMDWRQHNAVTDVKNQDQCGSCWAFSTSGSIEGQVGIHVGTLISLSEQQIVDCDTTNFGCNGGWPSKAYQYVIKAGGIESELDYPYKWPFKFTCAAKPSKFVARINSWTKVSQNEAQIAAYLAAHGPVSVIINAGTMQHYQGGIAHPTVSQCKPTALDHAVLAVGYDSDFFDTPYWIVKNSWSANWGEKGYWRVYRGSNVCGIGSTVTSAVI